MEIGQTEILAIIRRDNSELSFLYKRHWVNLHKNLCDRLQTAMDYAISCGDLVNAMRSQNFSVY
ncbi:hypothetical protein ACEYW6_21255 [Nostoc sp. UIC 10607]|uniref:hypothetical protein n=1 Tax=Nostoc sp. UIC 10607 TaxID=3045935 RepID=UPI0039A02358